MLYLIYFLISFIIIYLIYYYLFVRKNIKYDKKKLSSDIKILIGYYKIDIEKIGYQKVLRIMNFVNSLMLSLLMLIVIKVDNYIYRFLILLILMVPCIWATYYFLAKYLKYLEGKSEENV